MQGGIDERLGRQTWLYHTEGNVKTGQVAIKHGIFQGDSLSPLLLSSALIPLTNMLNKQGAGNKVNAKNKASHLFHTDILKLFSRDKTKLEQKLTTVKTFSDCIQMDFGLDKYATAVFKHGKLTNSKTLI
jgi:hypothetical protein